jgi:hypothetical protein
VIEEGGLGEQTLTSNTSAPDDAGSSENEDNLREWRFTRLFRGRMRDDEGFLYGLEEKQWTWVKRNRRRRRGGMIEEI